MVLLKPRVPVTEAVETQRQALQEEPEVQEEDLVEVAAVVAVVVVPLPTERQRQARLEALVERVRRLSLVREVQAEQAALHPPTEQAEELLPQGRLETVTTEGLSAPAQAAPAVRGQEGLPEVPMVLTARQDLLLTLAVEAEAVLLGKTEETAQRQELGVVAEHQWLETRTEAMAPREK